MNQNSKRIYYLDRIKILLCLLVIGLHTSIAYGGAGSWYYNEDVNSPIMSILFTIYDAVCQSFFMGLFFFISAYFTVPSYNKKGCRHFLKDRFIRLFIPLCIFYFILNPTTVYFLEKIAHRKQISYFQYMYDSIINLDNLGFGPLWLCIFYFILNPTTVYFLEKIAHRKQISYFQYMYDSIINLDNLGFGPLWFVEALIIFSIGYVLYRKIVRRKITGSESLKKIDFPGKKCVYAFMIILGIVSFAVRLVFKTGVEVMGMQLGYFPQYIALFALGTIAYENNWLHKITDKISSYYFKVSIIGFGLLILVLAIFMISGNSSLDKFAGGISLQAIIYALWEPFMCVGISVKLITVFRKKYDVTSDLWTGLSLDTYPVYVIHAPVNVFLECMLITAPLNPVIKFIIVYSGTCVICFALSHFILRRVPILRKIS